MTEEERRALNEQANYYDQASQVAQANAAANRGTGFFSNLLSGVQNFTSNLYGSAGVSGPEFRDSGVMNEGSVVPSTSQVSATQAAGYTPVEQTNLINNRIVRPSTVVGMTGSGIEGLPSHVQDIIRSQQAGMGSTVTGDDDTVIVTGDDDTGTGDDDTGTGDDDTGTGTGTGGGRTTGGGTVGDTDTTPTIGDVKRAANGTIVEFDGTKWVPVAGGTTREVITQDPNAVPMTEVAGADANMPVDRYMETLGVNSLAGQAYQEALTRRLASIEEQQLAAGQTYQDMYEQARMSQAARRGMSDVSGMTGGMADQYSAQLSAAEMASLGQIGMGRESAIRGLEQQRLAAPMEAFAEGQAIDQFETARQELERTRMMQDTEMQRAQTLFEQAQSGWFQDPTTGTWQNIDQLEARERAQIQDRLSLQAINAEQRAEVIGEMQYWQAVLLDDNQTALHESARAALGELQTRYANLLLNNQVMTGAPGSSTPEVDDGGGGPQPEPEPEPEPEGFTIPTGTNETIAANEYTVNRLNEMGITDAALEGPINILRTRIQDQEDLAAFIVEAAGDKAQPGYNFQEEINTVTRLLTEPTSLSPDEFVEVKNNTNVLQGTAKYYGLWDWQLDRKRVEGKLVDTFRFPDNPENREVVQYFIDNKGLNPDNITIKNGEYDLRSGFASGASAAYEQWFVDYYNSKKAPSVSATQAAGYSSFDPRTMG